MDPWDSREHGKITFPEYLRQMYTHNVSTHEICLVLSTRKLTSICITVVTIGTVKVLHFILTYFSLASCSLCPDHPLKWFVILVAFKLSGRVPTLIFLSPHSSRSRAGKRLPRNTKVVVETVAKLLTRTQSNGDKMPAAAARKSAYETT